MSLFRTLLFVFFSNLLLCLTFASIAQAESREHANQQEIEIDQASSPDSMSTSPAVDPANSDFQNGEESPLVCIDSWTGVHLAATALSTGLGFTPFKAAAIAADGTAHWANVELKHCRPFLEAPAALVLEPSSCTATVEIPIPRDLLDQLVLDNQIIEQIIKDPELELPTNFRAELEQALNSDFGYLSNETSGEYSNIYFIVNPIFSSAAWPSNWGELGVPEIYHFNSDVYVTAIHSGKRTSLTEVEFYAGSHSVEWTADTLIAGEDLVWIPDLSGIGAAKEKAKKETAKKTWKQTIKGWIKAAKNSAKDVYVDIAKNGAKKTKKKILKFGKKKLAKKAAKKSVGFVLDSYFLTGYTHDKTTIKFQRIYVLDKNAPSITGNTPVTVEALEPGGVSSGHHINMLKRQLNITDDCDPTPGLTYNTPRFWPLSLQEDGTSISSEISWTATDNGAASDAGGVNQTTVTQQVTVVDTKPPILVAPPPLIMEATATELMTLSLGSPQVFDVADLRPTISNDGPSQFTQGIYYINWLATDFSGNVSEATKDSVQVVNLKEPGTNNLPTAFEQTGPNALSAISFEPITITVRGQDGDTASSGDPDPLWFSIESQPEHGFFIAPLYPYFIDDYRMAARYSPQIAAAEGEEFAWQVAQSSDAMREYIKQLCEEDIRREDLPKDFVSGIDYIAVDDDGYTYIYDSAYRRCHHGDGSTVAPNGSPRISVWDQNGLYVGEQERSSDSRPLRDIKFNLGRGTIIATQSDGSSTGNSLVNISTIQPNNAAQPVVELQTYTLWNEINDIYVGEEQTRRGPEYKNAGAAAWDNTNGVLYVIGDQNQNLKGMVALKPGPCNNSTDRGPEDCLDLLGVQIYSSSIVQSTKWGDFPGVGVDAMRLRRIRDIALDTKGAVHIIAEEEGGGFHRIYKFAPATIEADGTVTLGELIGWMGKCDSGPDCDYVNGRSVGYSCTDETCLIDEGGKESGDRPGQFENAAALAFDPNDVLYVADSGNDRVQRFSSEGLFAGEARSSGDGSGFVLGDFGSPSNIAVNRGSFFILDSFREIVHVFDAAVIHGIDERSAWVEYQSENNFVGTDRFTFSATDGFRNSDGETLHSPPATVEINVTRNFRPPQATAGLAISVTEDMPTALVLEGYDIDGSLDTLTFQVVNPPADGSLSGTSPNLIYTPRENFDDEDGFFFTVSDGRSLSQPEEFLIQMIPVNDSPVLRLDTESFQAGVGFPFALQATAVDAEIDDDLTVVIDWGDGTNEGEGVAQNDGTLSGPVINESGVITRSILAYHTYRNPGTYNLTLTVTDPSGANDVIAQPIVVEEMADLALQRQGNSTASPTRLTLSYELLAINLPSSDGGITAADVQIRETLGEGLTYRLATTSSGTCAPNGKNLTCAFNALAPDAVATIRIVVDVDPALAVGTEVDVRAEISSTTSDPVPENNDDEVRMTMLPDADFLVNSPLEGNDSTLGDGLCETTEGVCTLRAAIQEANALPGKQRIALPRQTYMLNLDSATVMAAFLGAASRPSEDAAANGDLDITDDLDLIGLGADETTINANGQDRVIDVLNGAVVSIRGVALTGGKPNDEASSYGGGLRNVDGVVTLINVSVNANESLGGGGIANMGGSMEISASSITGNDAGQASGGGLLNQAQITLENVTVSGNRAGSGGGLQALGGAALLRNVTLVSNVATNAGGGINNSDAMGVRLANTIVADNIASFGPVCGFTFQSDGHNLLDNLTDCTILGETATNIIDSSFSMENLALSAASTYAHTPATDSPVIDAGRCDLETDQRGVPRPQQEQCDIGAIEMIDGEVEEIEPPKVTKNVYLPMMTQ